MAVLSRSDLKYKDYNWKAKDENDDPNFIGGQEKSMLDRTEGYEMLYFINSFLNSVSWSENGKPTKPSVETGQKAELLIRKKVPSSLRKRNEIRDWLINNWNIN